MSARFGDSNFGFHGPVPTLEFTPTRNGDPPSLNTVQLSV